MTAGVRYFSLLLGWLALFAFPMFAGMWYDEHYHVYQSITALGVIGLSRKLFPDSWWADDLAVVAMLQIVHAAWDFASPGDVFMYNTIQACFNGLEFLLILAGGISEAINGYAGTDSRGSTGRNSSDRIERRGHA